MAGPKKNAVDKYSIPENKIGKIVYTREGAITLTKDLSAEKKAFLVSQGVKLDVNEEATDTTDQAAE